MAADEGALRRRVEETQTEVDRLREEWANDRTDDAVGARLVQAREAASAALTALWDAAPGERPPPQRVL